jgi:hypothetical protein
MCLSRLLDDVIETDGYSKGATIRMEIEYNHLTGRDAALPGKRVVHLRGDVPFEIKKWNMKDTLKTIDI